MQTTSSPSLGANPTDYIVTNNSTANVVHGSACTPTSNVSFAPTTPGTPTASLQILSSSSSSPPTSFRSAAQLWIRRKRIRRKIEP
ncbi:hypothetical protein SAMN05421771_2563 [Granulicella pectinivorans]|uniref:Uncharacterized protein n=1 Tax=Granulicella pectinivorans TaxID=474950 RepID=A0A1I6MG48_9BACT|nr:hypothetical protein [Granulicella pectinivorans]SFS14591.1 hypothetical protein SAMN05421771_2563 [Granulicella pectinivorans]